MAHLYIPLDGVPIVPSPPGPDYIAADGWVVFALSVRQFYAYNLALGVWQPAGGGIIVADTDSIDLTDTAGTLTADVRISSDAAPVGSIKATITVETGASPGLLAVVAESDIKALFSVTDTDSIDLTYTSGQTSADLRLSGATADVGYQLVDLNVETGATAGLRAQISNASIQAALSVTDTNSLDLSYTGGALSGDVLLSSNAADAGNQLVSLDIQSTGVVGLRAQIPDSSIQAALTVADTDSLDLSYSSGSLSGDVLLSSDPSDLNYQPVELRINTTPNQGLHAQVSNASIRSAITVGDTDSIDFGHGSGLISADVRISAATADAGYTKVPIDVQASPNQGLRAQILNTDVQGLFSATAPVTYSAGNFAFDTATTTLTAYLLKTGGTMTGAIVSAIPYSNTGVVSTSLHQSGWINVNNNRETTLTFDATKGHSFQFIVSAINHAPVTVTACYDNAALTITTDQDNLYEESDGGSGFYIHKTAASSAITIKKNISGNNEVLITRKEGVLTSATAWA